MLEIILVLATQSVIWAHSAALEPPEFIRNAESQAPAQTHSLRIASLKIVQMIHKH